MSLYGMSVYICMYVYVCMCIYVCIYVYVYIFICMCMCVCMCTYVYTYMDVGGICLGIGMTSLYLTQMVGKWIGEYLDPLGTIID